MDKKTYEAPALNEVGSVEGLTLGFNAFSTNKDNIFGWVIPIGGPKRGS